MYKLVRANEKKTRDLTNIRCIKENQKVLIDQEYF